jgi:hypothetical protein
MSEAMVKPVPKKNKRPGPNPPPKHRLSEPRLAEILQLFGNDRAYTLVSFDGEYWVVHFEGDADHSMIKFEGEKPIMIKA